MILYVFSLSPERATTLVQSEIFEKISRHELDGVVDCHIQLVDESIDGSLAVDLEHPFGDRIAVGTAFIFRTPYGLMAPDGREWRGWHSFRTYQSPCL